ncbi:PAMP-induced secreted peptide 2, Precursor of PAMP-induced peptide 2 [Hibiscus trionum]|uniref:PAMP-induced secreted peptide 2, of PAMP-induced peptide 2 n=1 Tax=Hibiscus trionum TaxID=183268 RepID=A0A9W7J628_HIBTR|nr:PAMP-induced secreted peptide 2, Precursor of PAMP-induced peptide 2 [Hibiscus trionum]
MNAVKSFLIFSGFVLVSSSIVSVTEARDPFHVLMSRNFVGGKVPDLFDIGLYLGAIKESGPSGPGEGHGFANGQTLGGIKNSGPSPGAGHKLTNSFDFGGIKDSGPSNGGEGHEFTDSRTLGGIKNSGPSPGEGHSSTLGGIKNLGSGIGNRLTVLGGIKDSGPSPGVGNKFTDSRSRSRTHGATMDSGPSPGVGN